MGIKHLWTYLTRKGNQDAAFQSIDLAEEARRKGATAERRAELWCDYGAVVRQLEIAILKERHPKYCSYYGCDTRLLGQQMEGFVKALRSIHIEPVFVSDAPPGADKEGFRAKYEEIKSRQIQRRIRSKNWEDTVKSCGHHPSSGPPANIPNPQCYVVCGEVLRELEVKNLVTHCEADTVLMHEYKTSKIPLGILSSDTDIAVADLELKCAFLPLDFFDHSDIMGFHEGDINHTIQALPCRYTNRQLLANFLSLRYEDMTTFAILCGNDYTNEYAYKIKKYSWKLGKEKLKDPQAVAQWLNNNRPYSGEIEAYKRRYEGFSEACKYSNEFYSGRDPAQRHIHPYNVSQPGTLSPTFLSIKKGVFLQPVVAVVQSVKDPLPYTVSLPIRKTIYALCGQNKVDEYGFRSFEIEDYGKILRVNVQEDLHDLQEKLKALPFPTRAAVLHHLISTPLHILAELNPAEQEGIAPAVHRLGMKEVLRGIIAVSALAYFYAEMGLEEEHVRVQKVHSCLLAFAATSAGIQGDVDISHLDPDHILRAVSLSSTISVLLVSLYNVAQLLDLAPKASDIFCSSVFVPAYMAVMQQLPPVDPALAPVVLTIGSPHAAELLRCIRRMETFHGMPEPTLPAILIRAVHSYTALVDEMREKVKQNQQQQLLIRSISCR